MTLFRILPLLLLFSSGPSFAQVIPALQWVETLGLDSGTTSASVGDVAIGQDGSVVVFGSFSDTLDFDPGPGVHLLNPVDTSKLDLFVLKLDSAGNFIWAQRIGGMMDEFADQMVVDQNNNILIQGTFESTMDADPGTGVNTLTSNGNSDIYIIKLNPSGNFLWAAQFGGADYDYSGGLGVDPSDNVLVSGNFYQDSIDLNPGTGVQWTTLPDSSANLFVVKLTPAGGFLWGRELISSGSSFTQSEIHDLELDVAGNVVFAGDLTTTIDFDPGTGVHLLIAQNTGSTNPFPEGFIGKFDPNGQLLWAVRHATPSTLSHHFCLAVDTQGNNFVSGFRNKCSGFSSGTCVGAIIQDQFIQKYDSTGALVWDVSLGSIVNWTIAVELTTDDAGNAYLAGAFSDTLTAGNGIIATTPSIYDEDMAVIRFDPNGLAQWVVQVGPGTLGASTPDLATGLAICDSTIVVAGVISGTVDFDPGPGSTVITPLAPPNPFVLQLQNTCQSFTTLMVSACGSYTVPSGNATYTMPGTYADTLTNAQGCDSILNIQLQFFFNPTHTVVACDSFLLPGGTLVDTSGIYVDSLTSMGGCDSVVTTDLTVYASSLQNQSAVACDSFVLPSGGIATVSGTYVDSLQTINGCDSVIITGVTINNSFITPLSPVACGSYTSSFGNVYTASGNYTDSLLTGQGCDSVLLINLTIHPEYSPIIAPVVCDSFVSPGGQVLTSSGTYTESFTTTQGCDSSLTIQLTVLQSFTDTVTVSACESYVSPGGVTLTQSGTYVDSLMGANGCDSVITIDLTIHPVVKDTLTLTSCGWLLSPGGQMITMSGWYMDMFTNANGCDSLIWLDVTILHAPFTMIIDTVCDPPYVTPAGNEYNITGTYNETYTAQNGCDSNVVYQLEIGQVIFWVAISGQSLTAVAPLGSSYQWLDCNQNMAPVPGADSASLPVLQFQNYAVVVTQGFCSDTSECILTESLTVGEESTPNGLNVYPNPNHGQFTLELIGTQSAEIEVVNPMGQVVFRERMNSSRGEVSLDQPAAGTYWVRFLMEGEWRAVPVVVQ